VVALDVMVGGKVVNGCPQRVLSKQDHAVQKGLLVRATEGNLPFYWQKKVY
jgi:hypothetical protein